MDKNEEFNAEIKQANDEAQNVLANIRKTAAEQGVSQQAIYFKEESENHNTQSKTWLKATIWISVSLVLYAIISIFIHKIAYLKPEDLYQSIQLAVSKVLIFAVISYVLYLAARNFLAHKHNSIINKHRQNALMTYKALVDASNDIEKKEVILNYASACIFAPQTTGYSKEAGGAPTAKSVVELLAKPFSSASGS